MFEIKCILGAHIGKLLKTGASQKTKKQSAVAAEKQTEIGRYLILYL